MKLTNVQVQQVEDQIEAQVLPEDHPTVPQLEELFGAHTFFVGPEGLHVVERDAPTDSGQQAANVIRVASWGDDEKTKLMPHGAQLAGEVKIGTGEE